MGFHDDMADGLRDIVAFAGRPAVYTSGDDSLSVTVIASDDPQKVDSRYGARVKKLQFLESDVAEPKDGDKVVIGSDAWTIRIDGRDFPIANSSGMWTCHATGDEYRRR